MSRSRPQPMPPKNPSSEASTHTPAATAAPQPLFRLEEPHPLAKGIKKLASTLGGLAITLAVVFGAWKGLLEIGHFLSGLQKEVLAALIAASATILVSVMTVLVAKHFERKRGIEQEIRNKKIPVYDEFIQFIFKLMHGTSTGEPLSEEEVLRFYKDFSQKMIIWGSDEVIRAWVAAKTKFVPTHDDAEKSNALFEMERVLLAIRKDTGHPNRGLMRGDLLRLFINDMDGTERRE